MTTEVDTYAQAITLANAVRSLRESLAQLEAIRNAAIRRAASDPTVSRVEFARDLGISRPQLYNVLEVIHIDNGDGDFEPDFDALARADYLFDVAIERWEEAGGIGSPDDYFPLENTVANQT